jgi:Rod binding domain-containing protein
MIEAIQNHGAQNTVAMRKAANDLEAAFLAEMLKFSGVGEEKGPFSGGEGANQFGSFYREAQAQEMVKAGGIGLAQAIFESMAGSTNDTV